MKKQVADEQNQQETSESEVSAWCPTCGKHTLHRIKLSMRFSTQPEAVWRSWSISARRRDEARIR
jgi:ribosomal protein L44E